MRYVVTFSKDVILYDAKHNFAEVRVRKGKYRMINLENPLARQAKVELSPWIVIEGTALGMAFATFNELGFKIERTNMKI